MPAMGPGAMPLTRTPNWPHSRARVRVTLSTAALAADACTWATQHAADRALSQGLKNANGACGLWHRLCTPFGV